MTLVEKFLLKATFKRFSQWCKSHKFIILLSKYKGKRLLHQTSNFLENLTANVSKEDVVAACLPDVDILCIQEVWERNWAAIMIDHLGLKYSYFIHGKVFFYIVYIFYMFSATI